MILKLPLAVFLMEILEKFIYEKQEKKEVQIENILNSIASENLALLQVSYFY